MYQYAPEKDQDSLRSLAQSGRWKAENITFVSLGAQGGVVSLSETVPGQAKGTPPKRVSKPGYPYTIPTGQRVNWEVDENNGTEMIHISADGAGPLSPDTVLLIIDHLKKGGMGVGWECVSMEFNKDSRSIRIDESYSMQVVEGLLLKCYQHGDSTRVELADRRRVPVGEVLELFHALSGSIDVREMAGKVQDIEARVGRCEKGIRYAVSVATRERDGQGRSSRKAKKGPAPAFRTGAETVPVKVS
jgi:hypothetical protein